MPLKKKKLKKLGSKKTAKSAVADKTADKKAAGTVGKKAAGKKVAGTYTKQLPSFKQINDRHAKFKEEVGVKIIPTSKVRKYYKFIGMRSETELTSYLAEEIYRWLRKATVRAIRNNRKTVRGHDF